jgi:hypothetical protein
MKSQSDRSSYFLAHVSENDRGHIQQQGESILLAFNYGQLESAHSKSFSLMGQEACDGANDVSREGNDIRHCWKRSSLNPLATR